MVANEFWEHFCSIPRDRTYLIGESQQFTYGDICSRFEKFRKTYPELEGAQCAISSDSRFNLAEYLPLVAGLCRTLFLRPEGLSDAVLDAFYRDAEIEYELSCIDGELALKATSYKATGNDSVLHWLLATSGTTGTPKLASYRYAALASSSQKDCSRGQEFIWGLCYDLNRFAGLQVYIQAISSGSSLVVSEQLDLAKMFSHFTKSSVNCVSATPSFWRKVLMSVDVSQSEIRRITLGGEISDQAVLDALKRTFPEAVIAHIYASTEAGVGFSVKDGKAGFPVSYLDEAGVPGLFLKIFDGSLRIKSNRCADKVLNGDLATDDGYIDTGDLVEVRGERVVFLGRASGTINVGGDKVIPEEVEAVLNAHEWVRVSRVFGKKSPVMGMLVSAEIVLAEDQVDKSLAKKSLVAFCKLHLARHKVPVMFKFVDAIAMNASGKLVRK